MTGRIYKLLLSISQNPGDGIQSKKFLQEIILPKKVGRKRNFVLKERTYKCYFLKLR